MAGRAHLPGPGPGRLGLVVAQRAPTSHLEQAWDRARRGRRAARRLHLVLLLVVAQRLRLSCPKSHPRDQASLSERPPAEARSDQRTVCLCDSAEVCAIPVGAAPSAGLAVARLRWLPRTLTSIMATRSTPRGRSRYRRGAPGSPAVPRKLLVSWSAVDSSRTAGDPRRAGDRRRC